MDKRKSSLEFVSPICLLLDLIRNLWMVVIAALIFAMVASLFLSHARAPVYTASMTYAVTSKTTSYHSGVNPSAAKEVASVLTDLLQSNMVTDEIRAHSEELRNFNGTISASNAEDSNFINVTSTASDPESAFRSIRAVVDIFPSLSEYISDNYVVQIIRNPSASPYPSNTVNERRICPLSALIGAALMVIVICFFSVKRESIQTREGARQLLDAPIIGVIGHEKRHRTLRSKLKNRGSGLQVFAPTTGFAYTEQINSICAQFEHERIANRRKTFLITGVGENEGKSTVAANIAAALALKGKNVALIDADLRKPALNVFFDKNYTSQVPLNELLARPLTRESVFKCVQRNEKLGLYMLFAYKSDPRCTELITGQNMRRLLDKLKVMDYIIIDTPPMGMFPDAEALADLSDASLLVVRQNNTPACDVNDAADSLRQCRSEFLGCILNDMRSFGPFGYGYGYGYGRRYGYGYGHNKKKSPSKRSGGKK